MNEVSAIDNLILENQLTKLTLLVRQLVVSQHQQIPLEWIKFQQNMNTTMHDLKMQIGQLANSVSQIQSTEFGNLPLQTIPNPKGRNVSAVMLRSGKELQVVPRPKLNPTDTEFELDANSRVQQQARTTSLPFPS
ncbi:hypothetical protein CR513_24331, partial [Mucuna pruriens]